MELNSRYLHRIIMESLDELELYHGSPADFDSFDLAYISTGWGNQAYGYGFYLTKDLDTARDYSRGGIVYTVEVPEGRYLSYEGIKKSEAKSIARKFFTYYTTEDEYGREAYKGNEREFWEMECKYIADCPNGGSVYGTISSILGDDEDTSAFLSNIGYVGLEWQDENASTGKRTVNYVIFDPSNLKIVRKERV